MSFKGLDIDEQMFADMAASAENSGEKDPSTYGDKKVQPAKDDLLIKKKPKSEPAVNKWTEKPAPAEKVEAKPEPIKKAEPKVVEPEQVKEPTKPTRKVFNSQGVTVDSVSKILEMNKVLNTYLDDEKSFVTMYFQSEDGNDADVIYKALTSNPRELDALKMIVIAKEQSSAERAFYLMGLSNQAVEDVFGQLALLTDELGKKGTVTENNKLNVCRELERVISNTTDDMFAYIYKLKEFAEKALSN